MGVPKFYRWLSERYPCLSQVIKEHQIPDFDNLYLDMNGIIHPCSHPNDDDAHFRITEAEIFKNIFNYIEVLFRIIRPQKNFFMAVDGCAPRAKMNQQRSRRFRTAKDAEDNIRKALMKGHTLPSTERFDSNCITPGTEFMAKLQVQLRYFVNNKISTDPLWQSCNIYLSGHNVPGEGEHKIMDFIRYCKSQPKYDVNTRHCLYGLDADLIILGLVTHEPHFALLREEVRYGKDAKRMIRPEAQTFHLLHLSLLRQYIDFEFQGLKTKLHFQYNLERLIDDWVILGFLVGNDFVPHLPNLHINHDALPYLFTIYKEFLVTADGYINDGGSLHIYRLKKFFEVLSKFDRDHFQNIYADVKWLESKGAGNILHRDKEEEGQTPTKKFSELLKLSNRIEDSPIQSFNPFEISGMEDMYTSESPEKSVSRRVIGDEDMEVEDEETFELEFKQHKRHYYMEKFDMDIVEREQINTICFEYIRALQWIAHYYFNGLQSWSWYYPYHYSPYVSDIAALEPRELEFDMARPFVPYEQLLAVLPAASKKLLPQAYQDLMIDENSPIIDFYPLDFQTDLNGKQQDWEAVVLIPFINEIRLLNAMMPNSPHLTDEEKERNRFGDCYKYTYDKDLNFMYKSSYPGEFEDINVCKAASEAIDREKYHIDPLQIRKGLLKGAKLDVYCHGFPTMKHLKVETELRKAGVKVFQQHSRNENMIIKITSPLQKNMKTLGRELVGENIFVEWPYMVEAQVISICNEAERYYLDEKEGNALVSKPIKGDEYNQVKTEMRTIATQLMDKRGVQLGPVQVLVEVKLLLGQRYVCGEDGSVHLRKEWKEKSNVYPYQTVVPNLQVHTSEVEVCDSLQKLYSPCSLVFLLHTKHYGHSAEVIEVVENRVRVLMKVPPEPDFQDLITNHGILSVHYIPDRAIAQRLGISPHLLGRITGNLYVVPDGDNERGQNIGLRMKYSGQNKELLGFARRTDTGWTYSPIAIDILKEYMNKFPDVFEGLGRCSNMDRYTLSAFLPGKDNSYLDNITAFLRQQQCHKAEPVRCGSNILDHPIVDKIRSSVETAKEAGNDRCLKMTVKPHLLFRPSEQLGVILPDPNTEFFLFDRVVNVQYGIAVPIGLRGTIIGFHDVLTEENDKDSPTEIRYEVLFDDSFLADGEDSLKRGYFMSSHSLLNISYGVRKENEKQGASSTTSTVQSKISHLPGVTNTTMSSPYGARTPGSNTQPQRFNQQSPHNNSQTTPRFSNSSSPRYGGQGYSNSPTTSRYNQHSTPNYGNQRGSYSTPSNKYNKSSDNLVSPDYWLKGSYANTSNFQTPPPRRQILQHSPGNQQHSGGNYQHNSGNQQHRGGSQQHNPGNQQHSGGRKQHSGANDNHDFLNMWTELQKSENETIMKNSPTVNKDEQKDMNDATAMLHQMLKIKDNTQSTTTIGHPPGEHTLPKYTSPQHDESPKQTGLQSASQSANVRSSHASQGNPNLYNQQKQSNKAPLLNYMTQQKMMNVLPTMSPSPAYPQYGQGGYSLFGTPQNSTCNQTQSAILQQLCGGVQYPYNNLPQNQNLSPVSQGATPLNFRINPQQMGQHISSYQFPSPLMQTPVLYQTPQSFRSSQRGVQTPHQTWDSQPKQSGSQYRPGILNTPSSDKQSGSVNQFIPHQVMMKNTNLRSTDADNEIKEILGIKSSSNDEKHKDVKYDEKPKDATNSFDTKPLSDDDKLKGLLGIKPIVDREPSGETCRKEDIHSNQIICSSDNVSLNVSHNPSLSRQLETQNASNTPPTVAGATSSTSVGNQNADSGAQNKKPQILLAPSFFGAKKKSL